MTKDMQKAIVRNKKASRMLVRFANPRSKSKASTEELKKELMNRCPYNGERPEVVSFEVTRYSRNSLIKSAMYIVKLSNGKTWEITAYEHLKGRTPEQREEDKYATFPSGLFQIFHKEIK